ncbi:MAG: NAD+ synthase, partial [Alphaproteobacteria bacterium]|nr:NAD+ synthase [Alphaproteobacteria bacterium]
MNQLNITLASINPTVGDLSGNYDRIIAARAAAGDCDLVVFNELCLIGYPPEDIVLKGVFQRAAMDYVSQLADASADGGPALLIGSCWTAEQRLYNAAILLDGGRIAAIRYKVNLPNYGVFDEKRIFVSGPMPDPVDFRGVKLGIMTCEDMWFQEVPAHLAGSGAEILIAPHCSPFEKGKPARRLGIARDRVHETGLPLIYVNQYGGQDELAFDGGSFCLDHQGELVQQSASWTETLSLTRWQRQGGRMQCQPTDIFPVPEGYAAIYQAMVTGLRDYVGKNHFPGVILGMSGGIDSAFSAVVAVDALGPEKAHLVMMPS